MKPLWVGYPLWLFWRGPTRVKTPPPTWCEGGLNTWLTKNAEGSPQFSRQTSNSNVFVRSTVSFVILCSKPAHSLPWECSRLEPYFYFHPTLTSHPLYFHFNKVLLLDFQGLTLNFLLWKQEPRFRASAPCSPVTISTVLCILIRTLEALSLYLQLEADLVFSCFTYLSPHVYVSAFFAVFSIYHLSAKIIKTLTME